MATKPVPNWIEQRYALLWKEKAGRKFGFDDAAKILSQDKKPIVSIVLSELRRAGWLKVETNEDDTRKRFYKLVPIDEYIEMKIKVLETLKK